jgi:uncharacterized protein (DUF2267 family)
MISTHVSTLEATYHKTLEWLKELKQLGDFDDEAQAYSALRAVLQALRDRMTVEEASDLAAQLPMLVRGFYYEGWNPSLTPVKIRTRDEFLLFVREKMSGGSAVDEELAVMAVFKLLSHKISQGEIRDVKQVMPSAFADLWPHEAQ